MNKKLLVIAVGICVGIRTPARPVIDGEANGKTSKNVYGWLQDRVPKFRNH